MVGEKVEEQLKLNTFCSDQQTDSYPDDTTVAWAASWQRDTDEIFVKTGISLPHDWY